MKPASKRTVELFDCDHRTVSRGAALNAVALADVAQESAARGVMDTDFTGEHATALERFKAVHRERQVPLPAAWAVPGRPAL
ncbi:hypothetical protein LL06_13000 [Hoeflea sp. BAL378]|uniref:hypothetical protein n=1 Tax=Hoeflea sp. BAL378 TaxID=1547437 RepID=UPI00051471C2|nr:hypothetical protein [Hoeflea sp. BAL378]KGF69045.1 hypothetical protein LL06_13000 [Hoeflea sp. BAL378]